MGNARTEIKFSGVACPNASCPDFGIADVGNIAENGTYETQNERVKKLHNFVAQSHVPNFNSNRTLFMCVRIRD